MRWLTQTHSTPRSGRLSGQLKREQGNAATPGPRRVPTDIMIVWSQIQLKIEEIIQQKNIQESYENAMEHAPEVRRSRTTWRRPFVCRVS